MRSAPRCSRATATTPLTWSSAKASHAPRSAATTGPTKHLKRWIWTFMMAVAHNHQRNQRLVSQRFGRVEAAGQLPSPSPARRRTGPEMTLTRRGGRRMQFRNLGNRGPELSVVGFGAWAIGGPWQFGWGPQDDDESLAALHRAFDQGINWVDTAAVYGLGHSEEVVGQAVREHGTDVYIFTKCGLNWYGRADRAPQNDLRRESIHHVDSLQPPLSLLHRAATRELLPWCERHGSGVIAYSPMASGLLTGGFDAERMRELPPDDWRHRNRDFQEPRLSRNLALVERLQPIAERHGTTVAAVAVAWVIGRASCRERV